MKFQTKANQKRKEQEGSLNKHEEPFVRTLAKLWPYIWPKDRRDLQRRVFIAGFFLVCAKLVTAITPVLFKYATDTLASENNTFPIFALPPLMLVIAFIVGRILISAFMKRCT